MQRGQTLVQTHVARRLRQSPQQGHERLVRQIVRKEQIRIGDRRAHRDRDVIGIRLIDDRRSRLQLLDDHRPFFGCDRLGGAATLPSMRSHHLLVVLHVERFWGSVRGQHLVQVARARQVSVLDGGVGQQFDDFVDVRALARLVEQHASACPARPNRRAHGAIMVCRLASSLVESVASRRSACRE